MKLIGRILFSLLVSSMFFGAALSFAAEFPARSLTYLVTFDPGGQSDREARRQQPLLAQILKQNINIDYKVGGGGAMGWRELVTAKPDGYYFSGINIPHIVLQPMQQSVGYTTEQLVPISIFQRTFLGVAVLKDSPYKTLDDLLAAAGKNPGKLTIGGVGTYTGHHIGYMRLQKLTGVKLTYVPATGTASQMTTFLGGHTDMVMGTQDDLWRFRDSLRVLATTTDGRLHLFPECPSFKELGYDIVMSIDRGVAVPPKTPANVIAILEKAFLDVATRPEVTEAMLKDGFTPVAMGHKESAAYIKKMTAEYAEILKEVKQ